MQTPSHEGPVSFASVGRAVTILTGGTLLAQVVSIGRELFVASQVGLSRDLDALLIALALPLALSGALSSGTGTALVPAYLSARAEHGAEAARRVAGAVLIWVAVAGVFLAAILSLVADPIVAVTGLGLDDASRGQAADFLRLLAPIVFLAATFGILSAMSQAEERFLAISVANLAYPVTTLTVTVALWGNLGLGALAVGYLLGPLVGLVVLVAAMARASSLPLPAVLPRAIGLRQLVSHATPLTASAAILQLNVVADRAIASLLAPGAVSALRYGEVLVRTPITAIAPAWGAALYPALVRVAQASSRAAFGETAARAIRYVLVAFVPVALFAAALAPLAVQVAYGRGAFDSGAAEVTARVVAAFAPLIVVLMVSPILTDAHNARRHGGVLLATGALNVVMNFVFDVLFGAVLGVAGVALSSGVTSTLLMFFLAHRLVELHTAGVTKGLWRALAQSVGAAIAPAVVLGAVAWSGLASRVPMPALLTLVFLAIGGFASYVAICLLANVPEISGLGGALGRAVRRRPTV